jgi:hypothetical protein
MLHICVMDGLFCVVLRSVTASVLRCAQTSDTKEALRGTLLLWQQSDLLDAMRSARRTADYCDEALQTSQFMMHKELRHRARRAEVQILQLLHPACLSDTICAVIADTICYV